MARINVSGQWIDVSAPGLETARRALAGIPGAFEKAVAPALNRAIAHGKTVVTRKVRETYDVKYGAVQKTLQSLRATRRQLRADLISKGQAIPLAQFRVSPRRSTGRRPRKGLRVSVKRSGGEYLQQAFVGNWKGESEVLQRVGDSRLPIKRLFGPAVPSMLGEETISSVTERAIGAEFEKRLTHETDRILKGILGRY